MITRRLPVRPDIAQLRREAEELLITDPSARSLSEARELLAHSYQAADWDRLETACALADAIWTDDVDTVRALVTARPELVHQSVLIRDSNWGAPLSYAANLGRNEIIGMLRDLGATDLAHAFARASLQGQTDTARILHAMLGAPRPAVTELDGPAYTLNVKGTAFLLELGAPVNDDAGNPAAPVATVLQTDSRNPIAKHTILQLYEDHGYEFPDTPIMAFHRGRIDLLETLRARDASFFTRTFSFAEIFPPELGCHGETYPRTSLEGVTLLHLAVEFGELEIASWLLSNGMHVDVPAAIDDEGIGGQTALFHAVVCYLNFWANYRDEKGDPTFAQVLLALGADPNARASLRETLWEGNPWAPVGERTHRQLTPLAWGAEYHKRIVVNTSAMTLIAEAGGRIA
jgi:ankyrin repeat protein